MDDAAPLEVEIRRRIAAAGPMPVGEYMALCLADSEHGYYTTRDPLGLHGDFITAPEVSQMFGELIGLWMAAVWKQMGAPENIRIVELGPGHGTMLKDAMRAVQVMPAFREAAVLHLVEINPTLEAQQERTLEHLGMPMFWHPSLNDVPKGPGIVVANEFFDALPINQAIKSARGWHERQVGIDANGNLAFTVAPEPLPHFDMLLPPPLRAAPEESIFEWRDQVPAFDLGRRISRDGGAALVAPGSIDLTAHVDFQALAHAVEAMGATAFGPITQSQLLRRLGIESRAATLKSKASRPQIAEIDAAFARLTGEGRTDMGALFKAMAFAHPSVGVPPGFEP